MLIVSARQSSVRPLAAALYAYAFLTDLVLLYPVYAPLFADTGLSIAQISSLYVIWSATGILLEIPSGAWADAVSRRLLLCLAPLLPAAGFALWVLVPSYPAFAAGFLLWGAGGALRSGTVEALIFTELDRRDAAGRYARLMGRARSAEMLGVLVAMGLAGPVLALGGYRAVGAASIAACLLAAAVATRFPEHRVANRRDGEHQAIGGAGPVDDDRPDPADAGWLAHLRDGLAEARADRSVRAAVLLIPAVAAIWGALEEYTPLLARDTGVAADTVPLLLVLVWAGTTLGGLLTPLAERLTNRGYAALLTLAALALAAGALAHHPAGFVLIGCAFGAFQLATVLADVRLQSRIAGSSRATVTSVAGMSTDLTTIAVYAGYGAVATAAGNATAFAVALALYLVVAFWLVLRHT